jgi:hypothetical protein
MADYLAVKSYLQKYNLHYFTFSPNSEKPIKTVVRHVPPDTPAEDISNSLEDLGFNVTRVRQLTTNRRPPNGQTHVETLPLFLVTLTRNFKSQEIIKLNNLNSIIIKVEPYNSATAIKTLAKSGPTASNPLDVCGVVVATCIGNARKKLMQNLRRDVIAP